MERIHIQAIMRELFSKISQIFSSFELIRIDEFNYFETKVFQSYVIHSIIKKTRFFTFFFIICENDKSNEKVLIIFFNEI